MRTRNWLPLIAPLVLLVLSPLIERVSATRLFPNPLHVTSTVYLNTEVNEGEKDPFVFQYQVEEFVDMDTNRSSLSVLSVFNNDVRIFYNQLGPEEFDERRFIRYEPLKVSCSLASIDLWPLSYLRSQVIQMNERPADINPQHVDVALGPSGLLFAIEDHLDDFVYRTTVFSSARLTDVDVYTKQYSYFSLGGWHHVTLVVHLPNRGATKEAGDSLGQLFLGDEVESEDENQEEGQTLIERLNVVLVGACLAHVDNMEDDGADDEDDDARMLPHSMDIQLDEKLFCRRDKLLFSIHYGIVAAHAPGALVGKSLEDLGDGSELLYDFRHEPFVTPVGIGCWPSERLADPEWQISLVRDNKLDELSANYVTEYDTRGVNYVAYSKRMNLLRVDRNGRKSVYDLKQGLSYHVGQFSASHELVAAAGYDQALERCVVLDMPDSNGPQNKAAADLTTFQVLGLGGGPGQRAHQRHEGLHYMGARAIDHAHYEVFERRVDPEAVPLVLQTSLFRARDRDRVYVTYYAQTMAELVGATATRWTVIDTIKQWSRTSSDDPKALVLRFMELWVFDPSRRTRRLVNRATFSDFSWGLDVEPANEPLSSTSLTTGPVGSRLFEVAPCIQARGGQAQLSMELRYDSLLGAPSDTMVAAVGANLEPISEQVREMLVSTLEVSPLNIVELQVAPVRSASVNRSCDLVARAKIAELRWGISDFQSLGSANLTDDIFDAHIQRVVTNRHSLNECKLESIAHPKPNWFAYCPGATSCLLLDQSDQLKTRLARRDAGTPTAASLAKPTIARLANVTCSAYSLKYSTADRARNGRKAALNQAEDNYWLLARRSFRLELWPPGSRLMNDSPLIYRASPHVHELRQLDPLGHRLANEPALVQGLRYSTTREEPGARNMNTRVSGAGSGRLDVFRHCQLACQLDEQCGSFSVCRAAESGYRPEVGGRAGSGNDCVLSTVRLTEGRLKKLSLSAAGEQSASKFSVRMSSEIESQVLVMYRNEACTLHPRDFLADYVILRRYIKLGDDSAYYAGPKRSPLSDKRNHEKRRLTLDDCAGLSFEHNLFQANAARANFTYCPLDSHCILPMADNTARQLANSSAYCYVYGRNTDQAYERKHSTHLLLARHAHEARADAAGPTSAQWTAQSAGAQSTSALAEAERMESEHLVRRFWTSDPTERTCARECNLHQTRCLAYDACRQGGLVLCVLFPVRSPLVEPSVHLPLLAFERTVELNYTSKLVASMLCTHHYLKSDFFEVRLRTLLAEESGIPVDNVERELRIDQLESQIGRDDERASDEQAKEIEHEAPLAALQPGAAELPAAAGPAEQNQLVHLMSLFVGLLLGAVGCLYRHEIRATIGRQYQSLQERRALAREGRARLVLDDRA